MNSVKVRLFILAVVILIFALVIPNHGLLAEMRRDGRFIAYDDGTVLDTSSKLMWAARDNGKNISWHDAERYCDNYRGGGYNDWRMPTGDELASLYNEAKDYDNGAKAYVSACGYSIHTTPLIRLSCAWIWASDAHGSDAANFDFYTGQLKWSARAVDCDNRVLPVRSNK